MDVETKWFLFSLLLLVMLKIIITISNKYKINDKKVRVILNLFMFTGALLISFYLLRGEEFTLKYIFPIFTFIFLVLAMYDFVRPKSKFDEVEEGEIKWRREEASKNK